ncbi:MAG: hypothetical protein V7L14_03630 [Nostoc sp.]|uniref:hypothetical protein n=1 Tax=unclassified Nostoc TaxID=2593658 RepID=UPI0025D69953|nr:hypothetical protein [Nostoc sp. NOS(2021)]MBN3898411.1 hypothetical protein [Nostoc sp. NOS(2021)]
MFIFPEQYLAHMKKKYFMRLSERRLNKLPSYAIEVDKTMTQVIEEFIDSLPDKEIGKT